MKNLKRIIFAAIIVTAACNLTSCKKYEEGPGISLRSKSERVANQWKVTFASDLSDGTVTTDDHIGDVWGFTKDGAFVKNGKHKGTWQFSESKDQIIITETDGSIDVFTILKLKENEMWLVEPGDEEIHFSTL